MKKLMKTLTVLMCAVALVAGSVAGTFAWLTAKTNPITNTFTAGNISITLTESEMDENTRTKNFKMIPGLEIAKDPTVTVEAGSEDCWLFVKVAKAANFDTYMTWSVKNDWTALGDWTALDGEPNVLYSIYYRKVAASDAKQEFSILDGNKVTVKQEATKDSFAGITEENKPELVFTAYAVQQLGFETAAAAWAQASTLG